MSIQGRCIFAPHIPDYMQWSNMRQTRDVSQTFNETTALGNIFSSGNDFSVHNYLSWSWNFCDVVEMKSTLSIIGNDGVMRDSRPALPDEQTVQSKEAHGTIGCNVS